MGTHTHTHTPPEYCTAVPFFKGATPQDGAVLDGTDGTVDFVLEAESRIGTIFKFDYQSPIGMTSSDLVTVNQDGYLNLSWTLTPDQLKVEFHGFCFTATDSVGLTSERRCIVIKGRNPPTTTTTTTSTTTTKKPERFITDIHEMAAEFLVADATP